MDKSLFYPGTKVRKAGIYVSAGGRRVALSLDELFPGSTKGTGWRLEEAVSVERSDTVQANANRPVIMEPEAMEYAIETSWRRGWNSSLRALEVKLLAGSKKTTREVTLGYIAELRLDRGRMNGSEGDPE